MPVSYTHLDVYKRQILALSDARRDLTRQAAKQLVENIKKGIRPRDIVTKEAIDDAFALDMAMGGSTNTVLHKMCIRDSLGTKESLGQGSNRSCCPQYWRSSVSCSRYH